MNKKSWYFHLLITTIFVWISNFEVLHAQDVLVISEIQTTASDGIEDESGEPQDWIEIQNLGSSTVSLLDWKLTDDPSHNQVWSFPDLHLDPGEYLVVLASGKDQIDSPIHTSFSLNSSGEYLALLNPQGVVHHEYAPSYPKQRSGFTYGLSAEPLTLIPENSEVEFWVPTSSLDQEQWNQVSYSPGNDWQTISLPAGYTHSEIAGPSEELVGYWPFDGDVSDHARENHGTFVGGSAIYATGFDGAPQGSLNFDGTNDYVRVNQDSGLPIYSHEEFSVSLWVRGGAQADKRVFSEGSSSNNTPVFNIGTNSGNGSEVDLFIRLPSGSRPLSHRLSQTQPFDNTWHHLAWIDRDGQAELYVDGILDGQDFSYSKTAMTLNRTSIGAILRASDSFHFDGLIDDVSVWEKALSEEEIQALAAGGSPLNLGEPGSGEATDLKDDLFEIHPTAYFRKEFDLDEEQVFERLLLNVEYDAGFVAYLNGVEVARHHVQGDVEWDSTATAEREFPYEQESVLISDPAGLLNVGPNVLAVQALNTSSNDEDFHVAFELLAIPPLEAAPRYFSEATPGAPNQGSLLGFVEDTKFNFDRGYYSEPISLELSTETEGAEIYFTLDGSLPEAGSSSLYEGPLVIDRTTVVRARAFKEGLESSNTDTQTYLFLDSILSQSRPAGYPTSWNGATAEYDMDPAVVGDPDYADRFEEAFESVDTLSLVLELDDIFGSQGLYQNPGGRGVGWEKPVSAEWIFPEEAAGFQIDAGLRIHGNTSRNVSNNPKLGMRLLFKEQYGSSKLNYPLYGIGEVDRFDTLVLRSNNRDSWIDTNSGRRNTAQYIYDEYLRSLQSRLGQVSSRGRFVNLFINGLYWGVYQIVERPDDSFSAEHFGGNKEDYDVIKNHEEVQSGNRNAHNELLDRIQLNLTQDSNYESVLEVLDVNSLIDYMIVNMFAPALDWPGNYYMTTSRLPGGKFRFFCWDSDLAFDEGFSINRTLPHRRDSVSPTKYFHALKVNQEFQVTFSDRLHKAYVIDQTMNPSGVRETWRDISDQIRKAMVAEAARWGTFRKSNPGYLPDTDWEPLNSELATTHLPARSVRVLGQFRVGGLYSEIEAPTIKPLNDVFTHNLQITVSGSEGDIFYSTQGDPRLKGGEVAEHAVQFSSEEEAQFLISQSQNIWARAVVGDEWSPLVYRSFYRDAGLRMSEIHYHPFGVVGDFSENDFEFIEFIHMGSQEIDLHEYRIEGGVEFDFSTSEIQSLAPGDIILLVENQEAFSLRYSVDTSIIAGEFRGRLSNAKDRIILKGPRGRIVHDLTYLDSWVPSTDGEGYSLEVEDLEEELETWSDPTAWVASPVLHGTPGEVTGVTEGGFRLPGDANQDSKLEIGDAIRLLLFLYVGEGQELPCEAEALNSVGNLLLLDSNGDDTVDLSDAIQVLSYLFIGGEPPVLGSTCKRFIGCSNRCDG